MLQAFKYEIELVERMSQNLSFANLHELREKARQEHIKNEKPESMTYQSEHLQKNQEFIELCIATLGEFQIFSDLVTKAYDQRSINEQIFFIDESFKKAEQIFFEACKPEINAVVLENGLMKSIEQNTTNNMIKNFYDENFEKVSKDYQ